MDPNLMKLNILQIIFTDPESIKKALYGQAGTHILKNLNDSTDLNSSFDVVL
jgi:hypothetical protein